MAATMTVLDGGGELDLTLFALIAAGCAAANLFEVYAPGHFSLQPNLMPFAWGAALLPPEAIAAVAMLCFAPAWIVRNPAWFMPVFNVANYVLAGLALHVIVGEAGVFNEGATLPDALILLVGAGAIVYVNHALINIVAGLAGCRSVRTVLDSSVRLQGTAGGRMIDLAMATTGTCLAALWALDPAFAPLAAGPVLLMGLVVWVPMLRHESRVDPKTELFNSAHLRRVLDDELESAARRRSSVAVVMVDCDHMRAINNRFGHLEGDRLIRGAADVLREVTEGRGTAARFGGEEFCVLLPGASAAEAREAGEAIRRGVQQIRVGDGVAPSVSVGVAVYPEHGESAEELIHAADLALYDAKLGGRNRVRVALPPSTRAMLGLQEEVERVDRRTVRPLTEVIPREPHERPVEWQASISDTPLPTEPRDADDTPVPDPGPPPRSRRWLWPYTIALCAAVVGIAGLSDWWPATARPELLAMLVGMVLVLDLVRLDVFERIQISPASMPVLALAALFGPIGPIVAEAAIAIMRALRRVPPVKFAFDFGALSLAGAAAAAVFTIADVSGAMAIGLGVLAGLAYYAVNAPLLSIVIGLANGTSPLASWREQLAWLSPHYAAYGLLAAAFLLAEDELGLFVGLIYTVPVGVLWVAERQYVERTRTSVTELRTKNEDLETANARLRSLLGDNDSLLHRIHHSYLSTITSLARTIEARDPYTGGHTERVAEVTQRLATHLGFSESDLRAVQVGAVMHDIGKIGIPDRILLKEGPLTPGERAEMERHPEISSYILGELEMPALVKQMARSHHERFDGRGYPDRLEGEEIPLAARILTVADALDAITSNRPYRAARSIAEAVKIIDAGVGTQFCPRVVTALRELLAIDPTLGGHAGHLDPVRATPAA